jgi:hypothetical protein
LVLRKGIRLWLAARKLVRGPGTSLTTWIVGCPFGEMGLKRDRDRPVLRAHDVLLEEHAVELLLVDRQPRGPSVGRESRL